MKHLRISSYPEIDVWSDNPEAVAAKLTREAVHELAERLAMAALLSNVARRMRARAETAYVQGSQEKAR